MKSSYPIFTAWSDACWMRCCIAILILVLSGTLTQAQTVIYDNIASGNMVSPNANPSQSSGWYYSSSDLFLTQGAQVAEEFTVPTNSDYVLNSVTVGLAFPVVQAPGSENDPSNYEINLVSDNGGTPGSLIQTLQTGTSQINSAPSNINSSFTAPTFTAPNGTTLLAGQIYWIEVTPLTVNTGSSSNNISVTWFASGQSLVYSTVEVNDYNSSGVLQGWNNDSSNGGPALLIEATATPEPSTWAMLLGGFGLLAFSHHLKRRARV